MDITWRLVTEADVPAWTRLMAATEEVDRTGEYYDEADLLEEMQDPATGQLDRLGGWHGDEMVGYAGVRARGNVAEFQRIDAEGGVVPQWRGRGLGSHLVEWIAARSREIHAGRGLEIDTLVQVLGYADNVGQVELFESSGWKPVNWSAVMRISLADLTHLAEPTWPTGLSVHPYEARWSTPMREAHNQAFTDHWGFVPWDAQMWHQWIDGSKNFRPDTSWVVVDDAAPDVVVGYVQSNEFEAFEAATGRREAYLGKIGVRREYRGRGLASVLLAHSLRQYAAKGYAESSLDVDTNNPTGAFGLYERVGYRVEKRSVLYEIVIPGRE